MYVCPKCGGTRFTLEQNMADELMVHCENCGEPIGECVLLEEKGDEDDKE
jgi:predicted nucleic acid-binding Zn ribbon protein